LGGFLETAAMLPAAASGGKGGLSRIKIPM